MSWEERVGLAVTAAVIVAAGLLAFATADKEEAKAQADCTVPSKAPGANFSHEAKVFDDLSHDLISEAEHFVCHEIRHPAEVRGWKLKGIDAFRMQFMDEYSWRVHLRYTLGVYGTASARYLVLKVESANIQNRPDPEHDLRTISLRGRPAELGHYTSDPSGLFIRWRQDGLNFEAELGPSTGGPELSQRELIAFLRSVE